MLDARADRLGALRHPGALVKPAGHGQKRRDIHPDDRGPQRGVTVDRRRKAGRVIAGIEAELFRQRHRNPAGWGSGAQRPPMRWRWAGIGVGRVRAGRQLQHLGGIRHAMGKDAHAVEAAAGRHHAACGQETQAGLQPHQLLRRGRDAAAASGIGAQGKSGDPSGNRCGRAAGGATRDMAGHNGIAWRAMRAAHPHQAGGELVQIDLADQERPCGEQALHHGCVLGRHEGGIGAAGGGGQAGAVDIVLHHKGNAPERPATGPLRRQGGRPGAQGIGRHLGDEEGRISEGGDALQHLLRHRHRRGPGRIMRPQPGKIPPAHRSNSAAARSRAPSGRRSASRMVK